MEKTWIVREEEIQVLEQIISAVVASQIVLVDLLHAQGLVEKKHCASAFTRVIEKLGNGAQNRLLVSVLKVLRNSMLHGAGRAPADAADWLRAVLDSREPSRDRTIN